MYLSFFGVVMVVGCIVQVVQEIKVLRAGVTAKEREKAERATLKEQERLVKAKVGFL